MSLKPNPDAYSPSHITELEIHNDDLEESRGKGSGACRMRTSICPTGLNFGSLGLVYIFSEHPAKKGGSQGVSTGVEVFVHSQPGFDPWYHIHSSEHRQE